MILEGLVTTLGPDGLLNIAPMGPRRDAPDWSRFVLRPFRTSTTFRNLALRGEGVLHVTDDVLLIARAAIGAIEIDGGAPTRPASAVRGKVLLSSSRYYEFKIIAVDDRDDRATMHAETVATGRLGDLFGLNRGQHAVVEAAILATRLDFLDPEFVRSEFDRLRPLVEKTGGDAERQAFAILDAHRARRGSPP